MRVLSASASRWGAVLGVLGVLLVLGCPARAVPEPWAVPASELREALLARRLRTQVVADELSRAMPYLGPEVLRLQLEMLCETTRPAPTPPPGSRRWRADQGPRLSRAGLGPGPLRVPLMPFERARQRLASAGACARVALETLPALPSRGIARRIDDLLRAADLTHGEAAALLTLMEGPAASHARGQGEACTLEERRFVTEAILVLSRHDLLVRSVASMLRASWLADEKVGGDRAGEAFRRLGEALDREVGGDRHPGDEEEQDADGLTADARLWVTSPVVR